MMYADMMYQDFGRESAGELNDQVTPGRMMTGYSPLGHKQILGSVTQHPV